MQLVGTPCNHSKHRKTKVLIRLRFTICYFKGKGTVINESELNKLCGQWLSFHKPSRLIPIELNEEFPRNIIKPNL